MSTHTNTTTENEQELPQKSSSGSTSNTQDPNDTMSSPSSNSDSKLTTSTTNASTSTSSSSSSSTRRPRNTSRSTSTDSLKHLAKIETTLHEMREAASEEAKAKDEEENANVNVNVVAERITNMTGRVAQHVHRFLYRLRRPTYPELCACRNGEACGECLGRKALAQEPLKVIHWIPGRGTPFAQEPYWIWAGEGAAN